MADRAAVTAHIAAFARREFRLAADPAPDDALPLDSLSTIELVIDLEDAFHIDITDDEAEALKTYGHAIDLVAGKLAAKAAADEVAA